MIHACVLMRNNQGTVSGDSEILSLETDVSSLIILSVIVFSMLL